MQMGFYSTQALPLSKSGGKVSAKKNTRNHCTASSPDMIHSTQAQALMQMGFYSTQALPLSKSGGKLSAKKNTRIAICTPQQPIPLGIASKTDRLFLGNSQYFGRANEALVQMGLEPVNWCVDDETNVTACTATSFNSDSTTEEEKEEEKEVEKEEEDRGARESRHGMGPRRVFLHHHQKPLSVEQRNTGRERSIVLTNNRTNRMLVFLEKRNERLEHEERQIRLLQDLAVRERESNVVVTSCESQEEIVTGMGKARVTANEIERLSDDIKRRDATIDHLNEELARTKRKATEALEEVKEAEATKCREIAVLQNTLNNLMTKSDAFGNKVANLEAGIVSRDMTLRDARNKIISQAQLLVSSIHQLEKGHLEKVAALDSEIDELKMRSKSEVIISRRNTAKLERPKKIIVERDKIIERQKGYRTADSFRNNVAELVAEIASRDAELEDAWSTIICMTKARVEQEIFDPLHSQTRLLVSSVNRLKKNHLDRVAALNNEIDELKMCSEYKAIVSRQNVEELEWLKKMVAKKDETIERQRGYCTDVEREAGGDRALINEVARQEKNLDEKLERANNLFAELQEEF